VFRIKAIADNAVQAHVEVFQRINDNAAQPAPASDSPTLPVEGALPEGPQG
jgi:hypothetical protein